MNVPPYGDVYRRVLQPFANLRVQAQDTPDMTVKISAGGFWNYTSEGMSWVEYVGGDSPAISAPISDARWTIVTISSTGSIVLIDGETAASNPPIPSIPRGRVPLAAIYVQSLSVRITNDMIFDVRSVVGNIPKNHGDLEGTTSSGCHPISAISNLSDTLGTFATIDSVNTGLAAKADVDGTPEVTFTLNQDYTGAPSSNVLLEVERGDSTNVALRWNESTDNWEYTNNGTNWIKFADYFLNNGTQDILIKTYEQDSEPTLDTNHKACIWIDTNDSNKVYLVFRRGSGDQVKVELT